MDHGLPPFLVILWQVLAGISLVLFIVSFVFILLDKKLRDQEKMLWLLGTVLLPVFGPLLYLTLGRYGK